jgi:hypothetical protein
MNPEKAENLSPELQHALEPLLAAIEEVSERIVEYNDLREPSCTLWFGLCGELRIN